MLDEGKFESYSWAPLLVHPWLLFGLVTEYAKAEEMKARRKRMERIVAGDRTEEGYESETWEVKGRNVRVGRFLFECTAYRRRRSEIAR